MHSVSFDFSESMLKMSILCMNISIANSIMNIKNDIDNNVIDLLDDKFPICHNMKIRTFDNQYIIMKNEYCDVYYASGDKLQIVISNDYIKYFIQNNIINAVGTFVNEQIERVFIMLFKPRKDMEIYCDDNYNISVERATLNGFCSSKYIYKIEFIRSDLCEITFVNKIKNKIGEVEIYERNII